MIIGKINQIELLKEIIQNVSNVQTSLFELNFNRGVILGKKGKENN